MITKLLKLKNVGVLQDAVPAAALPLTKVTMIYGGNGRGKSTFCTVVRACSLFDPQRILARQTFDSNDPPEIALVGASQGQAAPITFSHGAWTGNRPDLLLFDAEFCEENVYSGFEIRPDQRQNLLSFALGFQAVQLRQQFDVLTEEIDKQTKTRTQAEKTLRGYTDPYTVPQFVDLQPPLDLESQETKVRNEIESARSEQQLNARRDPEPLPRFDFDMAAACALLSKRIEDVEESAEATVRSHLEKHHPQNLEPWLSDGQNYIDHQFCPFCGQPLADLALVQAYHTYFSTAYKELKKEIAELRDQVTDRVADAVISALAQTAATNSARIEAWKDRLTLEPPVFDHASLLQAMSTLREQLLDRIYKKQSAPLKPLAIGEDLAAFQAESTTINLAIDAYNADIRAIAKTISDFRSGLAKTNLPTLQHSLKQLEAAKKRSLPNVIQTVEEYKAADAIKKKLEIDRTEVRSQLDQLMHDTLNKYQAAINEILKSFGALFSIVELKSTYVGSGEPRTDYSLQLRSAQVKLGTRADTNMRPSFGTTLSEGDKRTLAFAFFLAHLRDAPDLASRIIVLDDPVSSLDRSRRYRSKEYVTDIVPKCQQLLVLSHDEYFLRDLKERIAELPSPPLVTVLQLKRVSNENSAFFPCDIDNECESAYHRDYTLVAQFAAGKGTAASREVAAALRSLLEGYYHLKFPDILPNHQLLGQTIDLIARSSASDPLSSLMPYVPELREINRYASLFHHNTNPDAKTAHVDDAELRTFAERVLRLIRG